MTEEKTEGRAAGGAENPCSPSVAVVGGGPGGIMAALAAAELGVPVTLYERNGEIGRKLAITGKGRCNVTNHCTVEEWLAEVPRNSKFLYGAASRFPPERTMAFFESLGVPLKTERGRRVFPISDRAGDIVSALGKALRQAGVRVRFRSRVVGVQKEEGLFVLTLETGETARHPSLVLATGGVSYPRTGSTGDGHRMAGALGLSLTPLKPSLIPVETKEDFSPLAGLTLKNVTLTVTEKGVVRFSELGEMLFTHFGVSGPLVLSASAHMQDGPASNYRMSVDLKPALSPEELDRRLVSDFGKYAAKDFINALRDLLPVKLMEPVADRAAIDKRKKTGTLTRGERQALLGVLKAFPITPVRFRPIAEAIVTMGGVDVRELNPKTMEAKKIPGLYFAGELIDLDAYTGGYNLQIAFATGRLAGKNAASRVSSGEAPGESPPHEG